MKSDSLTKVKNTKRKPKIIQQRISTKKKASINLKKVKVTKSKKRNSKKILSERVVKTKLTGKKVKVIKKVNEDSSFKITSLKRNRVTLSKILTYIFIFVLCFIFYFFILSPTLRSIKNLYEIDQSASHLNLSPNKTDLNTLSNDSNSLISDIDNAGFLFSILGQSGLQTNLKNNLLLISEYSDNANLVTTRYFDLKDSGNILSLAESSELNKLVVQNDKLVKSSKKIAPTNVEIVDSSVVRVKNTIEREYFESLTEYVSLNTNN